jgi:hypothetical protein
VDERTPSLAAERWDTEELAHLMIRSMSAEYKYFMSKNRSTSDDPRRKSMVRILETSKWLWKASMSKLAQTEIDTGLTNNNRLCSQGYVVKVSLVGESTGSVFVQIINVVRYDD